MLALGVLLTADLCAAVLIVNLRLSSPRPALVGPPSSDLLNAEVVEFPSTSGSALGGWWVPRRPGRGAVILMYGVWGTG